MNRQRKPESKAEAAFRRACELDVAVRKPGNVSLASPGHRMTAAQFSASAAAAAPEVCRSSASVGQRIEAAVRATWAAVGCNTNLGIVLLCAPLAMAAEHPPASAQNDGAADAHTGAGAGAGIFRASLAGVLQRLTLADAAAAFRAIALANPGGLGTAPEQDVRVAPSVTLREAMALAAPRDRIAQQYVDDFAAVFEIGLPPLLSVLPELQALQPGHAPSPQLSQAVLQTYLALLGAFADSHIVRKRGEAVAQTVLLRARSLRSETPPDGAVLAAWDEALKAEGINPGTTADLTVASLLVAGLLPRCSDRFSDGTESDNVS